MITKIKAHYHHRREGAPSPTLIAGSCAAYFLGAIGIGLIDTGFLLLAWLMTAFLAIAVYLTLDAKESLVNACTLFFGGVVTASVIGYVAT